MLGFNGAQNDIMNIRKRSDLPLGESRSSALSSLLVLYFHSGLSISALMYNPVLANSWGTSSSTGSICIGIYNHKTATTISAATVIYGNQSHWLQSWSTHGVIKHPWNPGKFSDIADSMLMFLLFSETAHQIGWQEHEKIQNKNLIFWDTHSFFVRVDSVTGLYNKWVIRCLRAAMPISNLRLISNIIESEFGGHYCPRSWWLIYTPVHRLFQYL